MSVSRNIIRTSGWNTSENLIINKTVEDWSSQLPISLCKMRISKPHRIHCWWYFSGSDISIYPCAIFGLRLKLKHSGKHRETCTNNYNTSIFWKLYTFYFFTAMPMEPMGFPQVGVGLQLVRDPTTGHLLLIHSPGKYISRILFKLFQSVKGVFYNCIVNSH